MAKGWLVHIGWPCYTMTQLPNEIDCYQHGTISSLHEDLSTAGEHQASARGTKVTTAAATASSVCMQAT